MRVTAAREYLASVRKHKVTALPPSVLLRECAELRRQLGQVLGAIAEADERDDGTEPYCTTCRQWAGMFHGMDGWHHFRGDPAPGGQRELYDAGHEPVIGWTVPPGRGISPAQLTGVLKALAAAADLTQQRAEEYCDDCLKDPAGCCDRHADLLGEAEEFRHLERGLTTAGTPAGGAR